MTATHNKKLIEVALPLPEINDASAYDKMPGIGPHPKGIHQWWARLPLPTARAILFASVVDDPEAHPEKWPTVEEQNAERERLFDILRRMMGKKLHEAPEVYAEARFEMLKHCDGKLPTVFDPFAGGGSIPLEANRMGFESHAGDLNPVAVLLNKCNLEITPRWVDHPPINPVCRNRLAGGEAWQGTDGLASDVRYYSELVRQHVCSKHKDLYPKIPFPKEYGDGDTDVIAWIWARTVVSPNPAAQGKKVPLISTYWLSTKKDSLAWIEPSIDRNRGTYTFSVKTGVPIDRTSIGNGTKLGRGARFKCLLTDEPISNEHLKAEAKSGRLGLSLLAIVAEGKRGRIYLSPDKWNEDIAFSANASSPPSEAISYDSRYLTPPGYGMDSIDRLFHPRQLVTLEAISDEVRELRSQIISDCKAVAMSDGEAASYANALQTFLALSMDRVADFNNSLCRWSPSNQKVMNLFGRQVIPMVWDFAEANTLGTSVGSWETCSEYVAKCIQTIPVVGSGTGFTRQIDAATGANGISSLLISTDPPYYDNVPYADISDFFYVWLRRALSQIHPELFTTMLVPKMPELTASPRRWGGKKDRARQHFESGFRRAFVALRQKMDRRFPLTVYYAFKQDDKDSSGGDNEENGVDLTTGWETLLEALISSGFHITGTWPVRASQAWRMRSIGSNALASYIVLACRPTPENAPQIASNQFRSELKSSLPAALLHLQQGNIAPVDFAQAAIGPGIAVYSRYSRILDSSGKAMSVRTALGIINQTLTEEPLAKL